MLYKKKKNSEEKVVSSGVRVLELLKALMNNPISTQEFFDIIEKNGNILFKKEAIWKYINTLKLFGFEVKKEKNIYYINRILETMDYTEKDLSVFKFLKNYSKEFDLESIEENMSDILPKIEKSFSDNTLELLDSKDIPSYKICKKQASERSKVRKFEQYCKDGLKLHINYKISDEVEKTFKISPLKIIYKKQKAILIAYDCFAFEHKEFLVDLITGEKQTPQKMSGKYLSEVIFKLSGRLAKSYVLKDGEKVIEFNDKCTVVSNSKEDKSMLLRRLIRYYDKCEITYPASFRKKMVDFIEDIEAVYD